MLKNTYKLIFIFFISIIRYIFTLLTGYRFAGRKTDFFTPKPDRMNIEHYTHLHLNKKTLNLNYLFTTHFEPLLLSLLVLTGFIGSIYLFGQNLGGSEATGFSTSGKSPENASISQLFFADNNEEASDDFDDFIKMTGKAEAGKPFYFEFLQDEKASRYVMEMGDGVRLIVTQKQLLHQYEQPGKYVIELKEIKGGLLHLIGTKKIKVK